MQRTVTYCGALHLREVFGFNGLQIFRRAAAIRRVTSFLVTLRWQGTLGAQQRFVPLLSK